MSKMKINKSININKLNVGNEIKTFGDSTFYIGDNFRFLTSKLSYEYTVTYIDTDYIILDLLNHPDRHTYILSNSEFIQKIKWWV